MAIKVWSLIYGENKEATNHFFFFGTLINCVDNYTILGATSIAQCKSMNQCETGEHRCHWLAACFDLPDESNQSRYGCRCQPGFVGNGFECTGL